MIRCSKCLLPQDLPGSNFNSEGECYWCQTNFPGYSPVGNEKLREMLAKNRVNDDNADCLVGFSGGKDSTYALLRLKNEYGMKVEAFTYVHEGTKSFSLENAKNICKSNGIKHHIVSLKNEAHLKSFKDYFKAWINNPTPTSANMTCVACKHLHVLGSQIAVDRKIPMIIWASSPLEYAPFLAIKHKTGASNFQRDGMSKSGVLMVKEMLSSPTFTKGVLKNFNTTLYGCLSVFPSSSYLKKRFPTVKPVMFFEFENWDPPMMIEYINSCSEWIKPKEVKEDWHSDCVFNIFKEYMFQKMYGASYTDAFLSNQVRYGMISREKAYERLLQSKKYFAKAVIEELKTLDLMELESKIDLSCFDVD